jgi:hypothetical protein
MISTRKVNVSSGYGSRARLTIVRRDRPLEVSFAPPMRVGRADEAILRASDNLREHDAQ